jgi:hypothetical protein
MNIRRRVAAAVGSSTKFNTATFTDDAGNNGTGQFG